MNSIERGHALFEVTAPAVGAGPADGGRPRLRAHAPTSAKILSVRGRSAVTTAMAIATSRIHPTSEDLRRPVPPTWLHDDRRERRGVHGVWKALRLKADACIGPEPRPALPRKLR